jgi:hypothetical protein
MELHHFLQKIYFSKLEFITLFKPDEIKFKTKKRKKNQRIEKVIFVDCANIFGTNFLPPPSFSRDKFEIPDPIEFGTYR